MKKGLVYTAGWAVLAIVGLVALPTTKAGIETRLKNEAESKLAQAGVAAVTVAVSGQDITLNGAPDKVTAAATVVKPDGFWTGPVATVHTAGPIKAISERWVASESDSGTSESTNSSAAQVSASSSSRVTSAAEAPQSLTRAGQRCQDRITALLARHNLHYRFNAYELTPDGKRTLRRIYRVLSACPAPVKLTITGHTDTVGDEAVNRSLSAGRAVAAMNALTAQGWPDAKVEAIGAGSAEPIASNATSAGRKKNRRVVFTLSPMS